METENMWLKPSVKIKETMMTGETLRALVLAAMLLIVALQAVGQERVRVSGTVSDEEGEPVAFALVRVEGQGVSTVTDVQGRYELSFTTADTVAVTFSMLGFETRTRKLFRPRGNLRLSVALQTQSFDIGEVTVEEQRRQMNSTQSLDADALRRLPSTTGNNVEELVAMQAGVSSHNELSSQYNVRGGNFDENSVYINGVEMYRPLLISSGQQEGLSVINSDMVEDISFSAGGFEARYGDKMSSVLDIRYKKPKGFEASAQASLLGAGVYVGVGNEHFSMSHGLRYKTNEYLLGSLETDGDYSPSYIDYQVYLNWAPNKRWSFDVLANISQNKYDFYPTNRETKFGTMEDVKSFTVYFDGGEGDLFRTFCGSVGATYHLTGRSELTLLASAYKSKEEVEYDIQGEYWLDEVGTSEELGVGTYLEHARDYLDANTKSVGLSFRRRDTSHDVRGGFTWKHETVEEDTREWEMRDSSGYSIPHTGERLDLVYNLRSVNRISSDRIELYAQDTWRFENGRGSVFALNYGARLSHWSWNGEWICSPRVSLGVAPAFNSDFTFRLALGLYYQAPYYKELKDTVTTGVSTEVVLNKDIKSQRSFQVVGGTDYAFRLFERPFKFTAEVYYKALSNLIPYNVDNVKIVYYGGNIGKGYTTGIDLKLYGEFVEGTDSWISFSLMKAEMKVNGKSFPQPTDQRYNLNFFFTDYFPGTRRWQMSLKACVAGGLPFSPPHTGLERLNFRAPAYKRVDIGMSYRLLDNEDGDKRGRLARCFKNVWLGIDCFNLLDISNVSSYYWVTDVSNQQYAVPNYLTGRQVNGRILIEL